MIQRSGNASGGAQRTKAVSVPDGDVLPSQLDRFHGCSSTLVWEGLYRKNPDWKKIVTPEAFQHPAKMAPRLCERIFEHLEELNLIGRDSLVVDPMGGTGTTNIVASMRGYRSVSVELETKFVRIEMKNREGVAKFHGEEPDWRIMQGDSRQLSSILARVVPNGGPAATVTSPPYFGGNANADPSIKNPKNKSFVGVRSRSGYLVATHSSKGNIGMLGLTSPPYFQQGKRPEVESGSSAIRSNPSRGYAYNAYGDHPQQIGKLADKVFSDKPSRTAFRNVYGGSKGQIGALGITSPPYANRFDRGNEAERLKPGTMQHDMNTGGYSLNPKNIGNTRMTGVTSPPYSDMQVFDTQLAARLAKEHGREWGRHANEKEVWGKYSTNKANIGNLKAGITSPPYINAIASKPAKGARESLARAGYNPDKYMGGQGRQLTQKHGGLRYSASPENLGNEKPEDYSAAMLKVYHEAFIAGISPLVTVTKNPTKNGKLVRLDLLTADLLTRAGYEVFDYHQAMFATVEEESEAMLDGTTSDYNEIYGTMGFFKILQVKKKQGDVAGYEDVIFVRIPS